MLEATRPADRPAFKADWSPHVALYRLYAENGVLLYVGISKNPRGRIAGHRRSQPWSVLIHDFEWEWCADRGSALSQESQAIVNERPLFNIDQNPGPHRVWHRMMEVVRFRPLPWGRIADYAYLAQHEPRILEPLTYVLNLEEGRHCGECEWPALREWVMTLVGFASDNDAVRSGAAYQFVVSTIYEALPWSTCREHMEEVGTSATHP